jgi:hypothetical protein
MKYLDHAALPTLSIVIPSIGRGTLKNTLASIRGQRLLPGDEIIVAGDGFQPRAQEFFHRSGLPGFYVSYPGPAKDSGGQVRNKAQHLASAQYLAFMDDDDIYLPGAFTLMRLGAMRAKGGPCLFRMMSARSGSLVWRQRKIAFSNVGTPNIVLPNTPGKIPPWDSQYAHDYRFIKDTVGFYDQGPYWCEEVIAGIRPLSNAAISLKPTDKPIFPQETPGDPEILSFLEDLVEQSPEGARFAEIGSMPGYYTAHWAKAIQSRKKQMHLFAVDSSYRPFKAPSGDSPKPNPMLPDFLHTIASQGVYRDVISLFVKPLEAANLFEDHSLDALFLHPNATNPLTLNAWYPKLKPGGILAGRVQSPERMIPIFKWVHEEVASARLGQCHDRGLCWFYAKDS